MKSAEGGLLAAMAGKNGLRLVACHHPLVDAQPQGKGSTRGGKAALAALAAGKLSGSHALALQACRSALVRVHDSQTDTPLELLAEDLRSAAFELGRVAGHYGVEDILGALFSTFCIGK